MGPRSGLIQPSGVELRRQPMILLVGQSFLVRDTSKGHKRNVIGIHYVFFENPLIEGLGNVRTKERADKGAYK